MKPVGLALLIPGVLILIFGVVDLAGSFGEFDLWGTLGVELPAVIWHYSAYIEIVVGAAMAQQGWARLKPESQ